MGRRVLIGRPPGTRVEAKEVITYRFRGTCEDFLTVRNLLLNIFPTAPMNIVRAVVPPAIASITCIAQDEISTRPRGVSRNSPIRLYIARHGRESLDPGILRRFASGSPAKVEPPVRSTESFPNRAAERQTLENDLEAETSRKPREYRFDSYRERLAEVAETTARHETYLLRNLESYNTHRYERNNGATTGLAGNWVR